MPAAVSGSPSENMRGTLTAAAGAVGAAGQSLADCRPPLVAVRSCQTISTRRAPGRSAVPMLVNAATGPVKNIAPNRLIHRSKSGPWKGWTWASACR